MTIGEFAKVHPTYYVELKNGDEYVIGATRVEADKEHGVVFFYNGQSAEAMFRIEKLKSYWRFI